MPKVRSETARTTVCTRRRTPPVRLRTTKVRSSASTSISMSRSARVGWSNARRHPWPGEPRLWRAGPGCRPTVLGWRNASVDRSVHAHRRVWGPRRCAPVHPRRSACRPLLVWGGPTRADTHGRGSHGCGEPDPAAGRRCWDGAMPRLIDPYTRTGAMVLAINSILVTQGVFGLTLRTIARESGISTGSLLHHFGHRERVLGVAAYETG